MHIEITADISSMCSHTAILKLFYNTVEVFDLCGHYEDKTLLFIFG